MHRHSAKRAYLVFSLALTNTAFAGLQATFPVNAQLPPVAYASQSFDFTFLPNTFSSSSSSQISYALANEPAWLILDSATRTFSGTPTANDVGAVTFELLASDQNGQASSNVTFVVLQQKDLSTGSGNILPQLAKAGNVSAPATLLLYPQQSFGFSLAPTLFNGVSASTTFYAVSSNRSPLPSWLQFDASRILFTGTTPPLLSQSPLQQAYSFRLVASNIVGYSEASITFETLIGDHHIAFVKSLFNYSTSRGSKLQIPSLLTELHYDGVEARRDQIALAGADTPSWLVLNEINLSFSGDVPNDAGSLLFSIHVDGFGANSANATIMVQIDEERGTFEESLGNVSVTAGSYLTYTIDNPFGLDTNTNVAVNDTEFPSWLSFTATNLTLQGLVPTDVNASMPQSLSFTFSNGTYTIVSVLAVRIVQPSASPIFTTSTLTASSTAPSSRVTTSTASNGKEASLKRRTIILVLAITLPTALVILLVSIMTGCLRKAEHRQDKSPNQSNTRRTSQLPVRETPSSVTGDTQIIPDAMLPYSSEFARQESAPHIELPWGKDSIKRARNRLSKRRRISHNSIVGSSWDDLVGYRVQSMDSLPSRKLNYFKDQKDLNMSAAVLTNASGVPPRVPVRPARPASLFSHGSSELLNVSKSTVRGMNYQHGLAQRLSGAGHGAGLPKHKDHPGLRSSWQTTFGSIAVVDGASGRAASTMFPAARSPGLTGPVMNTKTSSPQWQTSTNRTLRLVNSDSGDSESMKLARQVFYTQKTMDQLEGVTGVRSSASRTSPTPGMLLASGAINETPPDHIHVRNNKTPPIPTRSAARQTTSSQLAHRDRQRRAVSHRRIPERELSMASSRQFDSAPSSDSHWEDENVLGHEDETSDIEGQAGTLLLDNTLTPALQPATQKRTEYSRVPGPQLADRRRRVSIANSRLERSERSQKGSLRFI